MASTNEDSESPAAAESSSDDENLLELKKRTLLEREQQSDDSDYDPVISDLMVTIEIEEMDEAQAKAFDYSIKKGRKPSSSKSKSKLRKIKKSKLKKVHQKRTYPCPVCDDVFTTAQDLKKHSLIHQVKTRHKCEECGRYFKKAFSLRLHSKVHSERHQKCPLCDVTFGYKHNLARHLMTHEKKVECPKCDNKFHTQDQLRRHLKAHAREEAKEREMSKPKDLSVKKEQDQGDTASDQDVRNESNMSEESNSVNYHSKVEDSYVRKQDLSYSTSCAIVSKLYKGRTVDDICKLYHLTPEVVNELWEDREKYSLAKKAARKTLKYMNGVLDSRIIEWFNNQKANEVQVSGKMLQDIAEAFAKECGFVAFNGSRKWLDRFKKRYNISLRGTPVKRDYSNSMESKWKNQFFSEQWCDFRLGFNDEDIYTADEVGLYFNPSKGRIKKLAGKKYIQGYAKDRLAIFLCVNVHGTDKKKLLVCGTEDPLVHSHRDPDTLPVTYIRHSQAHFTTQMFEEYVKYWNRQLQLQNRKAILLLDRATIHTKLQLSHLKLVFVPWKASSGLMPIKNGIFHAFRDEYRRLFLEEKALNVIRGVDRNMTCLEALYILDKAWERTSCDVIGKSFVNTGYDVKLLGEREQIIPKVYDNDEEMICSLLKDYDVESYYTDLQSLDMFLTVDEELLTGQGTNVSVFGGNHKVIDASVAEREKEDILPLATEKPESSDKEKRVKKLRALQDLEIVKKYLQSTDTPYEMYCNLMEIEKFIAPGPISFD